jgi:hypothetical protein
VVEDADEPLPAGDDLQRALEDAGFAIIGRHASLAGNGDAPSPVTPLVLVAESGA